MESSRHYYGRIAGIIGVHPNTLTNWINQGKKIAIQLEQAEEDCKSIFDSNEIIIGIKNELLYKLFIESEKQHHVACAIVEARAIKTGNITAHMNVVKILNETKDLAFIDPKELLTSQDSIKIEDKSSLNTEDETTEFLSEDDIVCFLNGDHNE